MLEETNNALPSPWEMTSRGLALAWPDVRIEFAKDGIYLTRCTSVERFPYSEDLTVEISLPRVKPWVYRVLAGLIYVAPTHVQTSANVDLIVSGSGKTKSTSFVPDSPYSRREIDSCESLVYVLSEFGALKIISDARIGRQIVYEVSSASVWWFPDLTWSRTRKIVKRFLRSETS